MEPAPRLTLVGFQQTAAPDARLKLRRDCSSRSLLSESLVAVQSASPPLSSGPFSSAAALHPGSCATTDAEDASSNGGSFCSYAADDAAMAYARPSSLDGSHLSASPTASSPVAICYDRR